MIPAARVSARSPGVSNPEDASNARECEPVSAEVIQQELLAGINQLRRNGCDCMGVTMPKARVLKWDESLETQAGLRAITMSSDPAIFHSQAMVSVSDQGAVIQNEGSVDVSRLLLAIQLRTDQCQQIMNKDFRKIGASKQGCYWSVVLE